MKKSGFSLIELLVVVTIIAILSAVGIAAFRNVTSDARDAKRKADIDAIVKAYETKYDADRGIYPVLTDSAFTSGSKPTPPEGGSYTLPSTEVESFQICTPLDVAPGGTTCPADGHPEYCYCRKSSQGKPADASLTAAPISSCSTTFPQNCKGDSGYGVYVYTPAYIDCPATPLNCSGNSNYLGTFSYWNEVGVMQGNVMIYGEQATQATLPPFEGNTLKDIEVQEHQN